jgi:phage terminase small subunit
MRKLSERAAEFCRLIVYERESHARAYIHAGYADTANARSKAYVLLQKDYIQSEINRLNLVIAAEKLVDRNLMTEKYFKLAAQCEIEHDRATQKGCYDSICKLYGLSIDVGASGDSAVAELDDMRRAAAAAIPTSILLESSEEQEKPDNVDSLSAGDGAGRPLLPPPVEKVEGERGIGQDDGSSSIVGHPGDNALLL